MWPSKSRKSKQHLPGSTELAQRGPTALQIVCSAVAVAAVVAAALIVSGVAVLFGLGWALITAGALIAALAVGAGYSLLYEPAPKPDGTRN